jgi:hypothetical protein
VYPVCDLGVCKSGPAPVVDAGDVDAGPVDPIWGCLGNVPPPPAADKALSASFQAQFISNSTGSPLDGVTTMACENADVDCAQPLPGSSILSDADGKISMPVYQGFRGYTKITPNAKYPTLVPTVLPAIPIPNNAESLLLAVWPLMQSKDELTIYATSSGGSVPQDQYGHLVFIVFDCSHTKRAEGVSATIDTRSKDTYSFYTDNSVIPSVTLQATSKAGVVGFINLPPGPLKVTLRNADAKLYGTYDFQVRAGTLILATPVPN